MSSAELLQIGEFAKAAGTNLRTLRYYEEIGLVEPAERSTGGFRFYSPNQLHRVLAIRKLQRLGLPLSEIRDLLMPRGGKPGEPLVKGLRAALTRQRQIVEAELAEQHRHLRDIETALRRLVQCDDCDIELTLHCDPCQKDGQSMPNALRILL
jgi:DNA-binding transcriptional MerR regulator